SLTIEVSGKWSRSGSVTRAKWLHRTRAASLPAGLPPPTRASWRRGPTADSRESSSPPIGRNADAGRASTGPRRDFRSAFLCRGAAPRQLIAGMPRRERFVPDLIDVVSARRLALDDPPSAPRRCGRRRSLHRGG